MNHHLLLYSVLLCTSCATQSIGIQYENAIHNNNSLTTYYNSGTIENFTITKDLKPITIQVNVVILQDEKRKVSNFDLNNPEEKKLLHDYFEQINKSWSKFYQPENLKGCYTGNDFYEDSKVRFQFNYLTIKDSNAWSYTTSGAKIEDRNYNGIIPSEKWHLSYLDQKIMNDPNIPKGIIIYLTTDGDQFDQLYAAKGKGYNIKGIEASQSPTTSNLKRSSSINTPNRFLKYLMHRYQAPIDYKTTWTETRDWHLADAVGTAHELGHSLGLNHSNQYHGANQCKYALMSQNWEHPRNYVQPTELIRAHKNLRETNLIQFVTEDSFLGNTFLINQDTNWTKTQRFYSHLKLSDQVTLTIEKPIILAPQAKIEFGKEAKIIFTKEGKITLPNGKEFTNYVNKTAGSIQTR